MLKSLLFVLAFLRNVFAEGLFEESPYNFRTEYSVQFNHCLDIQQAVTFQAGFFIHPAVRYLAFSAGFKAAKKSIFVVKIFSLPFEEDFTP